MFANHFLNSNSNCNSFSDCFLRTMSSAAGLGKKLIAVCQLNCKENKDDNFKSGEKLIREAVAYKCSMVFLPECFDMICDSRKAVLENLEPLDGPTVSKYRKLASECKVWLSLGGLHEKPSGSSKLYY